MAGGKNLMSHPMHTVPGKFYLITRNGEAFPLAGTLLKYVPDGEDPIFSKYEEDPVQLYTTTIPGESDYGLILVEKAEYCEDNCEDGTDNESTPQNEECDGDLYRETLTSTTIAREARYRLESDLDNTGYTHTLALESDGSLSSESVNDDHRFWDGEKFVSI
jgi:hypothetical protein